MNIKDDINKFKLNNGSNIPVIGLGTGIYKPYGDKCKDIFLRYAKDFICNGAKDIKKGIRLYQIVNKIDQKEVVMIDTAQAYGQCERILGKAINKKPEKNVYIITKLSNTDQRSGNVERALSASMRKLGAEYIDLYLMHWPNSDTYVECWNKMEQLYEKGLVKAIGVCNFHICHLEHLIDNCRIIPMVNQFEHHPLLIQKPLVNYCRNKNIQVMAYAPTAVMDENITNNQILNELAFKYQKSISQIIFRWNYQNQIISIPATTNIQHYLENINIFNFSLTNEEMESIENLDTNFRIHPNPENCDMLHL